VNFLHSLLFKTIPNYGLLSEPDRFCLFLTDQINEHPNFLAMKFDSIDSIKKEGFEGFLTIGSLMNNNSPIPRDKGIYMILYTETKMPDFVETGTGGFYKGIDPNVPVELLIQNWVENTPVLYIGKAGKGIGNTSLHSRLRQYFNFGRGKNIGHRGGRFIWQIKNWNDLVVCWKTTPNDDPRDIEAAMIRNFYNQYTKRPFANLVG